MRREAAAAGVIIAFAWACLVGAALQAATPNREADIVKTSRGDLKLTPLYHGSVMLEFGGKVIHVDPWTRVYFSGDIECTPEMKALANISIAFLAMNPPRTMSTLKAAACAKAFRPRIVYPYHYRGSKTEEFASALKDTTGVEVRLRRLEGEP